MDTTKLRELIASAASALAAVAAACGLKQNPAQALWDAVQTALDEGYRLTVGMIGSDKILGNKGYQVNGTAAELPTYTKRLLDALNGLADAVDRVRWQEQHFTPEPRQEVLAYPVEQARGDLAWLIGQGNGALHALQQIAITLAYVPGPNPLVSGSATGTAVQKEMLGLLKRIAAILGA